MPLDTDACWRALETRDARFDGRFFIAVRSTGIYCRPICPAPRPKRENVLILPCAAAAQEAGFRPCLRCRPESAPGSAAWHGTTTTVRRALRLIDEGALDRGSVGALAARLGVGERHLRRLFGEHLGASPLAVAATRRLLLAKKLIDETALPMTQVALAAGYSSVRRFNHVVRESYGRTPGELRSTRGAGRAGRSGDAIEIKMPYRPPLALPELLDFLALRAIPGVEEVAEGAYRRTLRTPEGAAFVEVRADEARPQLIATLRLPSARGLGEIQSKLARLFDLSAEPDVISGALATSKATPARMKKKLRTLPGLRVPGCVCGFELAVRAILGQQVSVRGASTLAGRLVSRFGEPVDPSLERPTGTTLTHLFPLPEIIASADLASIGLPEARAEAIRALARAISQGELVLDGSGDPEKVREALLGLRGIGPWTASYIGMRALGDPDAFPSGDLVLRQAMRPARADIADKQALPTARALDRASETWRPWRAYAALYLWASAAD